MNSKIIMFTFDDQNDTDKKIKRIKKIVGKDNVSIYGINYQFPEIEVRCNKKQWKKIKFELGLCKTYI